MKIGYPCINQSLDCRAGTTIRLKSYNAEIFKEKVTANCDCLRKIIDWNASRGILFFRITSDLIPFASHPVCTFPWQTHFQPQCRDIGARIKKYGMRISMHPDQFVLLNAKKASIVKQSIAELDYHASLLDLLGLDHTAKIQIHAGGVYGDKPASISRFISHARSLSDKIASRLVIENDERCYCLEDVCFIHSRIRLPVLLDFFHHSIFNHGESAAVALQKAGSTWRKKDGLPMTDFSTQKPLMRPGFHADSLNSRAFRRLLEETVGFDFDLMLEIKDKEKSALKALGIATRDRRLISTIYR